VKLINLVNIESYKVIVNSIINRYVECKSEKYSKYLDILDNIIHNFHCKANYKFKEKISKRVIVQTFLRFERNLPKSTLKVMKLLYKWLRSPNIALKNALWVRF